MNNEIIRMLRHSIPNKIVKELVQTQSMPSNTFKDLLDYASTEEELIKNGYTPVSCHKLLWIKRD